MHDYWRLLVPSKAVAEPTEGLMSLELLVESSMPRLEPNKEVASSIDSASVRSPCEKADGQLSRVLLHL